MIHNDIVCIASAAATAATITEKMLAASEGKTPTMVMVMMIKHVQTDSDVSILTALDVRFDVTRLSDMLLRGVRQILVYVRHPPVHRSS